MSVYIAAPYQTIAYARRVKRMLELQKVEVTSRWLTDDEDPSDASKQFIYAQKALDDVKIAALLLALNVEGWETSGTGGRHVELGYALALGKKILLVGERTNVFHHLSRIKVIDSTADITKHVQRMLEVEPPLMSGCRLTTCTYHKSDVLCPVHPQGPYVARSTRER